MRLEGATRRIRGKPQARDGQARQEKPPHSPCRRRAAGAYRAGVGVQAGLGALGVGHRVRGEDERPAPRRGRGDGHPAAAPAVARVRAESERGVAGGGRGGRGAVVSQWDQGPGRRGGYGGHRHCSCGEEGRGPAWRSSRGVCGVARDR
jgi:hypothetical protein